MMNNNYEKNGVNIYGQTCVEKVLVLRKETAIQQYKDMMEDMVNNGNSVEYTIDTSCFTIAEREEFMKFAEGINIFYATLTGCNCGSYIRR